MNLTKASEELFRRSPDERFESLEELLSHCVQQQESSAEYWQPTEGMRVVPQEDRLGLTFSDETDPESYIQNIDKIKEVIGTRHLMAVNTPCLWKEEGKNKIISVITEVIKGEYGRSDLSNIFSGTFLRVLNLARGDGQ